MPRFITNEAALAARAPTSRSSVSPHEEAAIVRAAVARRRRRPLRCAPLRRRRHLFPTWYGFEHPRPDALGVVVVRPPGAEPRRAAGSSPIRAATRPRSLLALAPIADAIEPTGVVVDAKSGMTGAGRSPAPHSSHAGVARRQRRAPSRRRPSACARDRGAARVPRDLRTAPPARAGEGSSQRVSVRSHGADLRGVASKLHYAESHVVDVLPEGVVPGFARVQQHGRRRDRGLPRTEATGDSIVICALDNLGKGAAGQAIQNVNLLYGLDPDDRAAALPECSSDVGHGRWRVRRVRCARRHPAVRSDLAVVRSTDPCRRSCNLDHDRILAAPVVVSKRHLEAAQPQAVVVNAGIANAATGEAGLADAVPDSGGDLPRRSGYGRRRSSSSRPV